ncbi:molybdopterin-binding protein [Dactylosporangium sp. AC04546]|uniref:molybdopterin molybdotransferase MoeA n=1 Tax=Dactylosporangium sp. AC04546 TaxID=2862460 RepID=UPI001EE13AD8|nr:molybdopterin-binding protein [Dactylosporangium sp. AC04546]WVK79645.1 molybdopterin-binding protein [Dactylosporangium sp. AC04546]
MQLTTAVTAWHTAYAIARDRPAPLPAELTPVTAAVGRVAAAPARARSAVPAFDTAAMDGYAVAGPGPWTLTGRVLAGPAGHRLAMTAGTAVEIATGAVVPAGAEAVLQYETSHRDGSAVTGTCGPRDHIRRAGADVAAGDLVVAAGRVVTATTAAAAVQAGVDRLWTHRPPTVTLLVTGDEVVRDGPPGPGQVRDVFTGLVEAVSARAQARLSDARHVPDRPDRLQADLDAATSDVVVVTGASSAGAADHLHTVVDARHWIVRGVACRPGHPQGLAALPDGRWVVSLPGNPYAGLVAALTLLDPLLAALSGRRAGLPRRPVTGTARLVPDGVRIVPARHDGTIVPATGSGSLHAAASADYLAVLPADWTNGDNADVLEVP